MTAKLSDIQPQYRDGWSPQASSKNRNTHTDYAPVKKSSKGPNQCVIDALLVVFGMILCAIPLAVISVRYVQALPTDPTTTASTSVSTSATTTLPIPSQCTNYTINTDSTRNVAAGMGGTCDNFLTAGWYRFMGGAGSYLATTYVSRDTCTTWYGGSYNGTLPTVTGATTTGTLCLNNNGYLCYAPWSGSSITVTNCGTYYVYYLIPMTQCNSRYCTTA